MKKIEKYIRRIRRVTNQVFIVIFNRIFNIVMPLKKNRVLFLSDERQDLGGNLKAVYDFLPNSQYKKVVSLKANRNGKRGLKDKIKLIQYLSTSKYILLEDLVQATSHLKVRKGQELIQLWHGPGAFKRFGHSRESSDLKNIHKGYKKYTRVITSSEAIRPCYAEAFAVSIDKVKATGIPRTDIFFDEQYIQNKKEELYHEYPFLKGKKVILFAPTYRGTQFTDAHYGIENLDLEEIYNQFSKQNYIFIFKWHPFLYNKIVETKTSKYNEYKEYPDFYYDLSKERDINDFLLIADILITDYSSVIFDYVLTNKPIIYFTYDYKDYVENGRGLYFPFDEYVYGTVAKNSVELVKAIANPAMEEEKRKKFIEKFMSACDGKSTQNVVNWIFKQDGK